MSHGTKRLSPHFTTAEFKCSDGTPVPPESHEALRELCVNILEPLREKYGACHVNSGYRTRTYNRVIGGARYSQHIYDDGPAAVAAEVTFAKGSPRQGARSARWRFGKYRIWRRNRRGGVGCYVRQNFIHVDSGPRRDWEG